MTRRMVDYRCGRPAWFGRTEGWKSLRKKSSAVVCGRPHSIGRSEIRGPHGQIGPSSTMNTYRSEQSSELIDDKTRSRTACAIEARWDRVLYFRTIQF